MGVVVTWWIGTGVTCGCCCWWFGGLAGGCWVWGPGWFVVLPAGCWGGRDGVPEFGWFGVPGVPPWGVAVCVAGPGDVEWGVVPPGVDVDGDVVGVLEGAGVDLGGVDWEGVDWVGLWPGVGVRLLPDGSEVWRGVLSPRGVVLWLPGVSERGGVRSPRSFGVVPGVLREVALSFGVVLGVVRGVVPSFGVGVPGRGRGVLPSPAVVGLARGEVRSAGDVPGVFRGVVPASPVGVPPGRCAGIRLSGVPGVRLSPVAGVRPSGVGAGVLRGTVGDVGRGVEAGPVPAAGAVPGVPEEGFLAGPELGCGLVADGLPPDGAPLWLVPGAVAVAAAAVGDVGMPEPPSERPPEPLGEASLVVGVGAALDCVGAVAARLSTWVPIEPPEGVEDVPGDDVCVGVDCGDGDDRPDTEGPPPLWEGPGALGEPVELVGLSEPLGERPPGDGSSKSDRDESVGDCVGLEYGVSEEDGLLESVPGPEPESGPGPRFGPPMSLPPVSADMPLPMFVPGRLLPLLERVDVEESEPFELDESLPLEFELELEDDEESEDDEEELELSVPGSLPTSPLGSPDVPS
ncbi:hypothetical protein [Streptomyces sp. JHA19]|uniref:hypothetical protein n=1 Tax=Streptomyces sp. JHA19 TaxID=1577588 RepID=UPI00131B0BB3|nr:hypothetical protein [Streptomyces sp. JHA19]